MAAGQTGGHHAAAGNAAVANLPAMRWGGGIVVCRQVEVSRLILRPSAGCTCWSSLSGLRPGIYRNGQVVVAGGHTSEDVDSSEPTRGSASTR
jgi:hypothetical protein